jgi:hypothetical protein
LKTIKSLSREANELRAKFQQTIVKEHIKREKGIGGYKGQIYFLLPKFDQRNPLYKGVPKSVYCELHEYLFTVQSQKRFSQYRFFNQLDIVKSFIARDITPCYSRVWHSGVSAWSTGGTSDTARKHFAAQAAVLYDGVEKYGFTYYPNDYNFGSHLYQQLKNADPLLVSIYTRILERKMAEISVTHEN